MKKILLVGNYFAGNYGDDLLMLAARKGLKKSFPDAEIKVMAGGKGADYPLPPAGIRSLLKFNFIGAKKGLEWCDFVVFGGGGLLNVEVPASIRIWGKVIKKASKLSKKVYLLGQSFPEVSSSKLLKLLSMVELVTVRDCRSYKFLQRLDVKCPVRLTADLVFSLDAEQIPQGSSKFDEEFVAVNVREYENLDKEFLVEQISRLVDHYTENTPLSVYFVPFGPGDAKIMNHIISHNTHSGRVLLVDSGIEEALDVIRAAKAVISVRLHPSIVASIFKKPLFGMSYSSKTLSFFEDSEVAHLDLRHSEELNHSELVEMKGLNDAQVQDLKKRSLDNFKYLRLIIEQ